MKALIELDVPEWQIGQEVAVYFPDTMRKRGKCEAVPAHDVPVQSLIDHIKTAIDVDPWAKVMVEELLSAQEPLAPEIEGSGATWWHVCGNCHTGINPNAKYCHQCGRAVKWDA